MSIHAEINDVIGRIIIENDHVDTLSPTYIALQTLEHYGVPSEVHIKHLSFEQAKQMARMKLRKKFGADGEENPAHQDDMFSGLLQERYPIPVPKGADPQYKWLRLLTESELDWNITHLFKSADARIQHAHALQAHRDSKYGNAA